MADAPIIVFTDLDGTLLDHETYGWAAAEPTLARLRRHAIPLVLASSKTAAEMIPIRDALGFPGCPLICENGAGVVGEAAEARYAEIRAGLDRLPAGLRRSFEGFGDMGPDRIAEVTGLAPDAARRAAERRFSEPGLWHGDAAGRADFLAALAQEGLRARSGGRFLTLSHGATKADRMGEIAAGYGHPVTIALGDAPNDAEMIAAADRGIVVTNPNGPGLPPLDGEADGRIVRSDRPGPEGWNRSLGALLTELGLPE